MMVQTNASPHYQNYLSHDTNTPHYRSPTTTIYQGYKQQVFTPMSVDSKMPPPMGSLFSNNVGNGQKQFNGKKQSSFIPHLNANLNQQINMHPNTTTNKQHNGKGRSFSRATEGVSSPKYRTNFNQRKGVTPNAGSKPSVVNYHQTNTINIV
jgi:hypothetical protein